MLLADDEVGEGDQVDHPGEFHRVGQRFGKLAVQPDGLADHLRQFPTLGEPFADDHVIEADDRALDIRDVSAQKVGGFNDAGKAFGKDRIEGDFAQIVN